MIEQSMEHNEDEPVPVIGMKAATLSNLSETGMKGNATTCKSAPQLTPDFAPYPV